MAPVKLACGLLALAALLLAPCAAAITYDDVRAFRGDPKDGSWWDTTPARIQVVLADGSLGSSFDCRLDAAHDVVCADSYEAPVGFNDANGPTFMTDGSGTVAQLSAEGDTVCRLFTTGNVACDRHNDDDTEQVVFTYTAGDVVQVSGQGCMLKSDGTATCAPSSVGALAGLGSGLVQISSPDDFRFCGVTAAGDGDCWVVGPDPCYASCPVHDHYALGDAVAVSMRGPLCFLLASGNTWCKDHNWDYNGGDAISLDTWTSTMDTGGESACVVTAAGATVCKGLRSYTPPGGGEDMTPGSSTPLPEDPRGGGATAVVMADHDACWTYRDHTITCETDPQPAQAADNLPDDLGEPFDSLDTAEACGLLPRTAEKVLCGGVGACFPNEASGFALKDKDGDGNLAVYATAHTSSVHASLVDVGLASHRRDCWAGGDPNDDGVERAAGVEPPVQVPDVQPPVTPPVGPRISVCYHASSASPIRVYDRDRDGIPALYSYEHTGQITRNPDDTYSWIRYEKPCWLGGDPDDDGVDHLPA